MKKNLLIISDGNGVDVEFKKWPFYLRLLLSKTHNIINKSVIGASNEMMMLRLVDTVNTQPIDQVIMQWSVSRRVDLIVDDFWEDQAAKDPKYFFNIVENHGHQWWVTSASENEHVKLYHQRYVPHWLARQRSETFWMAGAEFCRQKNLEFVFSLCYKYEFSDPLKSVLETYPWVWHQPNHGISDFRHQSKYASYDRGFAQPHSLIGLEWINEVLRPGCAFIDYPDKTFYNIEQALLKQCSESKH